MSITKLSSKGQITIPKDIRDKLKLEPGDKVLMEATEHAAVIRPLKKPSESMKGVGKETKSKLGNISATELLKKMRMEDQEEL
ncbi:MAG: AbrB/MazE/SpoVT family DNA-binding domain-containing protein [Candidatus Bathyarchaeia archaeon]|jgi:AbrB family looped-hinge helix DNA binding protein|nr:AbrB/MazE/SpoVT family DNA-binding domain-containing protein [Candidatus Bathyarchaeia archaeon]